MSALQYMREGLALSGFDGALGRPVIFQHGLGGDDNQTAEVFPEAGLRRLTLECRSHGKSEAGDPARFSIMGFADDTAAFAASRGVERYAVGGISMGAAIALRIAVRHPDRVSALIIGRPAWIAGTLPDNIKPIAELAEYVARRDRNGFVQCATGRKMARGAPDNFASMLRNFDRPDAGVAAALLSGVASSSPGVTLEEIRKVRVPALVIGNGMDFIHPLPLAREIAGLIPGARLVELFPKALDKERHASEFRNALGQFLQEQGNCE